MAYVCMRGRRARLGRYNYDINISHREQRLPWNNNRAVHVCVCYAGSSAKLFILCSLGYFFSLLLFFLSFFLYHSLTTIYSLGIDITIGTRAHSYMHRITSNECRERAV